MSNQTITTATFRAEEQGVEQTAAALGKLQGAAGGAAKATDDFTRSTDTSAKKIGTIEREVDRLQRQLAGAPAAWTAYERGMRAASSGLEAGKLTVAEYQRSIQQLQQQLQRVVAPQLRMDVDTSGLAEMLGATQKVSAATRQATNDLLRTAQAKQLADAELARGQEALARETARYSAEIENLRAAYDPAYASAQKLNSELEGLARLEREGIQITGGYAAALDRLVDKYDETGRAARQALQAQDDFVRQAREAQMQANAAMDARRSAEEGQSRYTAPASLGVAGKGSSWLASQPDGLSRSAKEIASVFEEEARAVAQLRAEINPLGAAFEKMTAQIATYEDMARRQVITSDELALATGQARKAFDDTAKGLPDLNGKVKLTTEQMRNLGYQTNDVVTMYLSGSSPFQIMATQAGQVIQALQDGPGLRGSLTAIGDMAKGALSFIGPGGWVVAGLTAAAAAATLFGTRAEDRMERVNKAAEGFGRTLADIRDSNAGLADTIEQIAASASKLTPGDAANKMAADIKAQQRAIEEARQGAAQAALSTGGGMRELFGLGGNLMGRDDLTQVGLASLTDGFLRGSKTAKTLRSELLALQAAGRVPNYLKEAVDGVLAFANAAVEAGGNIEGFEKALRRMKVEASQLRMDKAFDGLGAMLPDVSEVQRVERAYLAALASINQSIGSDKALDRDGLRETARRQRDQALAELSRPAKESLKAVQDSLSNLDLSPLQRQIAETTQEYDRRIEAYKRSTNDAAGLADLLKEKEAALGIVRTEASRAEEARQAAYKLQLASINDVTAAQRAATAGQQAYNEAVAAGQTEAYARDRQAEAATLSMAEARQQLSEAGRQQTEATQRQIEQAQLEYDLVGRSAGEVARLRTEFDLLAQAKDAARAAGFDEAQVQLTDEMRRQAAEVGRLTEATQRLNFERDLLFDRQQATRSPEDQQIAEQLRAIGVDFESAQGRADAAQLRLNKRLHETNDALYEMRDAGKAAILELIDSIGSGEDALGAFANAFAGLGRQMAASGLDKIMDALLGGSTAGGRTAANDNRSGGGIVGAIVAAVTGNVPIPTSRPSNSNIPVPTPSPGYQSPSYPYADKYSVPALTKATASLDAAAKAIRTIESGSAAGNYSALGPITRTGDRAYGAYQVMGANIPQWSKQAIGRVVSNVEFLGSKEIQDAVFKSRFGDNYAAKYGLVGASQAWFAGEGGMRNLGAKDVVGTSVSAYGSKFSSLLDKHSGTDTNDQKIVAKGVSQGLEDYQRKLGPESYAAGRFDPGGASSATGGLFGPRGQAGMQVLGAGLGAFGAGYQSGSPVSGGITGALGGYQAGGAISTALNIGPMAGGVLGVVGGAALGILGGILGARKQREQAHRDKAAKWEELRPQYEAFDKSLSGDGNGQLRQWITAQEGQFAEFRKVGGDAWKYGQGNSSAQFASTGTKMWTRFMEMQKEYREGVPDLMEDLTSGEGYEGAFAKGRAATKELKQRIKDMIDDVSIAFGSDDIGVGVNGAWTEASKAMEETRNKAIAEAKTAAGEYALSLLYTASTTSDVEKSLDGFRGTAAGLQKVLTDLGWTAEAAATDIDDRLKQAIAKMGETFTDGFQAQINDLSGLSYLNDAKDLLKARDTAMNDAKLLGVDPEIVSRWFKLASQDLVDGSELVGSAFDDLIKAFPELSGVVHAFTGATRTQAEAARAAQQAYSTAYEAARSQIQSVYQTVLSFRDGLRSYQDQLKVSDSSTLSQADQVREAQRIYDETLAKANAGDKEAMNGLTGAAGDLLSKAKDYFKSSPKYVAIFESVSASLKAAEGKATGQLSAMERSASWLKDIAGSNLDIAKAVADLGASLKNLNGSRQWGAMADQNKAIWKDLQSQGIDYTGNFGGGQFLDWVKTQLPSQQAVINAIIAKWSTVYAPKAAMRFGGIVGAYAGGGVVGNGIWDRDSVLARYAGGGEIALAGGEGVINAPAMNKPGVASMVARLNRGVPDPYPRTEMLRRQAANVNAEGSFASRGDMREVTARLDRIVDTLSEGFGGSIEATNRLSSNAQQSAYAARRAAIKAGKAA